MQIIISIIGFLTIFSCTNFPNEDLKKQNKEFQKSIKDSITLLEKRKKEYFREIQYLDSISYEFERKLASFLGLITSNNSKINASDTMLTFYHDFSFAGYLAGKFIQIHKNDSNIYLTQVFYTNQEQKGEKSFSLVSDLTGENLGNLYADKFRKRPLSLEKWNYITSIINKYDFLNLEKEDCGNIVLDGTFTRITFHTQSHTHSVKRHHCLEQNFHKIHLEIDSLSPNPIQLH